MGETKHKKLGSQRRRLLTPRLRDYFEELKADLEPDSEAFLQNVIAHAPDRAPIPHDPRPRRQ